MTLGSWFKDYVFYSVSLSKPFVKLSKKTREHMNAFFATFVPMSVAMFIVWFGTGIWHGASWKYVMSLLLGDYDYRTAYRAVFQKAL